MATLTVVDGADNLAAYTPVFATADAGRIASHSSSSRPASPSGARPAPC